MFTRNQPSQSKKVMSTKFPDMPFTSTPVTSTIARVFKDNTGAHVITTSPLLTEVTLSQNPKVSGGRPLQDIPSEPAPKTPISRIPFWIYILAPLGGCFFLLLLAVFLCLYRRLV